MVSFEMSPKSEEVKKDPNIDTSDKFWGNDVIWREITSYLNITDLKEFSRVNQYFRDRVRSLTRFGSLAGQIVTGEMEIHTFKLTRAMVRVKLINENVLQDLAPTIFQDTEYLELQGLGVLSDEDLNSRLVQIVSNCPKLKSLTFGAKNFLRRNYTSFFKDTKVKSVLSNIKELNIGVSIRESNEVLFYNRKSDSCQHDPHPDTPSTNSNPDSTSSDSNPDSPSSDPNQDSPASDPNQDSPSSDPNQDSPSSDPNQDSPSSDPNPDSPSSDPSDSFSFDLNPSPSYDNDSLDEEMFLRKNRNNYDKFTDPVEIFKLFLDLDLKLEKLSFRERQVKRLLFENTPLFHPDLILTSSQNTLTNLSLTIDISVNMLEILNAMKFPNLSQLKLEIIEWMENDSKDESEDDVNDDFAEEEVIFTSIFNSKLIPFLRNHISTLTEFKLHSLGEFCLVPFCEVLKSSKKIKVLNFGGHFTQTLHMVNWNFLGGLSTLRCFKIYRDDNTKYDSHSDEEDEVANLIEDERRVRNPKPPKSNNWDPYLTSLPSTIKSIVIRGFNYSGRPEDLTTVVTSQLTRFENLTELKMMMCPKFFNDDILQFICKNLNKLRVLKGDFVNVTDFGISGCRDDGYNSGISLKNLAGMTKLAIHCSNKHGQLQITWEGLLRSIQFLDLVHLSITAVTIKDMYNDCLSTESKDVANYNKLMGQNPSFESISLGFCQQPRKHKPQVFKAHSRISRITRYIPEQYLH